MKRQLILTALALVLLMGSGCAMDPNMTHVKVGMSVRWKDRVQKCERQHRGHQTRQVRQEHWWEQRDRLQREQR